MLYNGKEVFTFDTFSYSTVKVGDYVEEAVVDYAMNIVFPACMRSDCSQVGEPYSHYIDPDTGKLRPVFATFKHVTADKWQYCGHCFRGENVERGAEPDYMNFR